MAEGAEHQIVSRHESVRLYVDGYFWGRHDPGGCNKYRYEVCEITERIRTIYRLPPGRDGRLTTRLEVAEPSTIEYLVKLQLNTRRLSESAPKPDLPARISVRVRLDRTPDGVKYRLVLVRPATLPSVPEIQT